MKKRSLLFKSILFVACSWFWTHASANQGGSSSQTAALVSANEYHLILDAVFANPPQTSDLQYLLVLRFMPSLNAESEIAVRLSDNGEAHAVLATVIGTSVWNTANDYIQRTGGHDVKEIARRVRLVRRSISLSPVQASTWHADALKSLAQTTAELRNDFVLLQKSGGATIFLDGTTYELRLTQGLTDISWIVMDAEVNDHSVTGRSSLVKWMNSIRQYSLSHAAN